MTPVSAVSVPYQVPLVGINCDGWVVAGKLFYKYLYQGLSMRLPIWAKDEQEDLSRIK